MPGPQRNGVCATCGGRVRHYPHPTIESGGWAHLDRADWWNNPHDPNPTPESLAAAGLG